MLHLVCYLQFCRQSNEEEQLRQEFTNSGKTLMTYPNSSGAGEYQQQPQTDAKSAGPNALSGTRNGSHNEFIQKVNLNLHTYMCKY